MEKALIDTFVAALTAAGKTDYYIRCEGGNRVLCQNGTNSLILQPNDSVVLGLEVSSNWAGFKGPFDLKCTPYSNIDDMFAINLTVDEVLSVMTTYGVNTDEVKSVLANNGVRWGIKPGTNGMAVRVDSNGNPILEAGLPATVTKGDAPGVSTDVIQS